MDAARRETNLSPSLDRGQAAMHRQAITFSYDRDCMPSPLRIHRATIRPFSTRLCAIRRHGPIPWLQESHRVAEFEAECIALREHAAEAGLIRRTLGGRVCLSMAAEDSSHASAGGDRYEPAGSHAHAQVRVFDIRHTDRVSTEVHGEVRVPSSRGSRLRTNTRPEFSYAAIMRELQRGRLRSRDPSPPATCTRPRQVRKLRCESRTQRRSPLRLQLQRR